MVVVENEYSHQYPKHAHQTLSYLTKKKKALPSGFDTSFEKPKPTQFLSQSHVQINYHFEPPITDEIQTQNLFIFTNQWHWSESKTNQVSSVNLETTTKTITTIVFISQLDFPN